jgi:hypothetical protein
MGFICPGFICPG